MQHFGPQHAISQFACKDETRPSLCAVYLDLGKSRIVATNGHFIAYTDLPKLVDCRPEHIGENALLCAKAWKKCETTSKQFRKPCKLDLLERHAEFTADDTVIIVPYVRGEYPRYEQVIPNYDSVTESAPMFGVNPNYLELIGKYAKRVSDKGDNPLLRFKTAEKYKDSKSTDSPILIEVCADCRKPDEHIATIVLMPMRCR